MPAVVTGALFSVVAVAVVVPIVLMPIVPAAALAALLVLTIGIGTRRTLANLLAGLTLLVAQPYSPGEQIRLFVDAEQEVLDVEVLHVGLLHTTLCSGGGMITVANTHLLRTPVGA